MRKNLATLDGSLSKAILENAFRRVGGRHSPLNIHRDSIRILIRVHWVFIISTWDRCYDFKNSFAKKIGEKIGEKIGVLTQNKAKLCKNLIITLVFEKNAKFFDENWQKSLKIVIITSAPDLHYAYHYPYVHMYMCMKMFPRSMPFQKRHKRCICTVNFTLGTALLYYHIKTLGTTWRDSNPRHLVPDADGLPLHRVTIRTCPWWNWLIRPSINVKILSFYSPQMHAILFMQLSIYYFFKNIDHIFAFLSLIVWVIWPKTDLKLIAKSFHKSTYLYE
jgi:hypothetical protein